MLSERLGSLIKALGLKDGEFAKKINYSHSYISIILGGKKTNISDRFYDAVKWKFNVNPDWLKNGDGEMFLLEDQQITTPLDRELISKYYALPLHKREIIDEVVDALLLKSIQEEEQEQ